MTASLCITFRFIQPFPLFHGSGEGGAPEWPPSPMRAFQALVNATSLRYRGKPLPPEVESALSLLETIRPAIIAPDADLSEVGYRAYVPHNQADLVSAAWHRGNIEASIAAHRIEKDIRPVRIIPLGDATPELHYLFPLDRSAEECQALLDVIRPCVRSISALGWGIDLVAADAKLLLDNPMPDVQGHRWQPGPRGRHRLRVQRKGSLQALRQRHVRFLHRLIEGKFSPVPPLAALDIVPYVSSTDPLPRPHAVFKLLDDNEDPARYPHAKLIHIAGMVRHLAIEAMQKDPPPWIPSDERDEFVNRFIRGKRDPAAADHKQISYVPLPSIGHEHADGIIRNVMLIAPFGMERELAHLASRLDGQALKPEIASAARAEGGAEGCQSSASPPSAYRAELRLFIPPDKKFIATHYLGTSRFWQTVTPVIFDGHVKRWKERDKDGKEIVLTDHAAWIAKALQRAGIETPCQFEWQAFPHFRNCLSAHKYDRDQRHTGYFRPNHLDTYTACHLRVTFDHPVPGPVSIGAGRHCGLGVLAAIGE